MIFIFAALYEVLWDMLCINFDSIVNKQYQD